MLGSNSKQNKAVNVRLVLAQIATQGPLSRADIARSTFLSKQTITNQVDELIALQLVQEAGIKKEKVGKPSTMLLLQDHAYFTIGLRLWPDRLELALCSLTGQLLQQSNSPVPAEQQLHSCRTLIEQLCQQHHIDYQQLLGVGMTQVQPGHASLIQQQQQRQLFQQQLATALQLPVVAAQTAAACAAYHLLHGEARQLQSFCYIHLGQSIEAALVYHRTLLLGQNGFSGALGEIFVTPEQDHSTGDFGRLNDFVSMHSLQQFISKKMALPESQQSSLILSESLTPQQADKLEPWLVAATEPMRVALHTLETLFNCQSIIIGGEVSDGLLDKLISKLRPFIPSIAQYGERQVPRLIKTPDAGAVALKGLSTLPLHAAIRADASHPVALPQHSSMTAAQQLLFAGDHPD